MKKLILKNKLLIFMIVILMVLTAGCGQQQPSQETNHDPSNENELEPILIGVSTAITGDAPLEGERTRQGVELAMEEINAAGGVLGRKLKAIYEDDQNNSTFAVNAVNKLCSEDIVALLGPHRSTNALAVEQIVAKNKIPFLTGATSPKLAQLDNPYAFRVRGSDTFVARVAAIFAVEELGAQNLGLFYNTDEYGTGGLEVMQQYLAENNIEPVIVEGHNTGDKDMTGQITKARDRNVDCLVVWTHPQEGAVIARQINELGLEAAFIGSTGLCLPTYYDLIDEEISDGWYGVTDFIPDNPDPIVNNFVTKFQDKYGVVPDLFAATYYNATYLVADAIERAGSADREAIRNALSETKDFIGVYGVQYANEANELIHETSIGLNKGKTLTFYTLIKE